MSGRSFSTIFPSTLEYFEILNTIVQEEPIDAVGPEVRGYMASIGIVKGKPFNPDERMKKLLSEAATCWEMPPGVPLPMTHAYPGSTSIPIRRATG